MTMLPPVVVALSASTKEFTAKMGEAKAELGSLEATGNTRMAGLAKAGKIAATGVAVIAVAAIAAGAEAVHMASSFQESTTQLITGAGESEANIEAVRKGILAMSGAVGTMPEELSKGMYLIESAGYHGAQGLAVLKAAAQGAKVGGADMAVVANGLTTAMTDYNIPASRANAVTSALVATVASGKMKMGDLANSLGMVMPKASALGVSFADVTGALATMTGAGMTARRASMNLAATIVALGGPSKGAQKALAGIGLSAQQVKDDLSKKGLAGTIAEITDHVGTKFPKGSVAGVNALKAILGGTTGYGTALALTGSHAAAFTSNVKNIGGALNGQAKNVEGFALTQKDLAFQVDAAKASASALGIKIGTALIPVVTKAMGFVNSTAIPAIRDFAKGFAVYALPAIRDISGFIAGTAVPAISKLAGFITGTAIPAIRGIAKWIGDNKTPITIVAGVITALFIPALVRMGVQAAISGAETVALWVMIQASAIASTASQVAQFVIGGAKWVWSGVQAVASAAVHVGAWLMSSAGAVAATVVSVAQFVIQGAKWVWMGVTALAGAAQIAAAWLISLGPIGIVIAAVAAVGIFIATHMDLIKGWISGAWNWIKSETSATFTWVKGFLSGIWSGITGIVSSEVNGIRGILGWFGNLGGLFTGWFSSATAAASGALGSLVSFVAGLPGRILGALGNLGGLLVSAGVNIVQGLIRGIGSMASSLVSALIGLLPGPLQQFAGMLGLHSPSTVFAGFGTNIVQGLINGIEGSKGALGASVASLASMAVAPSVTPMGALAFAGGASGGTGSTATSGGPSGAAPTSRGPGGPLLNIENYHEARQPIHLVAADLAFKMRTA